MALLASDFFMGFAELKFRLSFMVENEYGPFFGAPVTVFAARDALHTKLAVMNILMADGANRLCAHVTPSFQETIIEMTFCTFRLCVPANEWIGRFGMHIGIKFTRLESLQRMT